MQQNVRETEPTNPAEARKQILLRRDIALDDIKKRRGKIHDRIDELNLLSTQQDLSSGQKKEFDDLVAAKDALNDAESELQLATLEALDKSAANDLVKRLNDVNAMLVKKLKKVERVSEQLTKLAELVRKIDGVIQSVTKLATLIP